MLHSVAFCGSGTFVHASVLPKSLTWVRKQSQLEWGLELGGRVDEYPRYTLGKAVLSVARRYGMGTTNRAPIQAQKAGAANKHAAPPPLLLFSKLDRITGARLQGGFAECLGQRWL